MKKFFALVLAIMMVMSLAVPAAADGENIPEVTDTTNLELQGNTVANRQYEAYKLMSATNVENKYSYVINERYAAIIMDVLNITPAAGETNLDVNTRIVDLIKVMDDAAIRDFANDVYDAIKEFNAEEKDEAKKITADERWKGATATIPQGYWLIVDVSTQEEMGNKQTRSMIMLDTVGDAKATVTTKDHPVEEHKKIDDENDSLVNPDAESEDAKVHNRDVADYDLGDHVPYNIYTKLPGNVSEYEYFIWEIEDTASKGLSFDTTSFKIVINTNKTFDVKPVGTEGAQFVYEIVTNSDGSNTLYVYPNYGYTKLDGTVVPATGEKLNKDTAGDIKKVFEQNSLSLEGGATVEFNYTCKLNENAVIGGEGNKNTYQLIYSNDPHNDSTGETKEDVNIVLTWKTIVNKIDGHNSEPLEGADFELYKFVAEYPKPSKDEYSEDEIKNKEDEYKAAGLVLLETANAWGKWEKVTSKTTSGRPDDTSTEDVNESTVGTTFTFSHIDDGIYKLEETKTPEGYNKIDPIIFKIKANHAVDLTDGKIWSTADDDDELFVVDIVGDSGASTSEQDGSITMNIVNKSGAELPSTGGMGTTLFYVLGSVLVMGALVMLITKKRMAAEN